MVGLVGESGCGKSTLGRMVAGILPPSEGTILWRGRELRSLSGAEAREAKLRTQMIFQDPMPRSTRACKVADIVGEAPMVHGMVKRRDLETYVDEQMRRAGLDPAFRRRYPHQFSGGQRQRIGIARALAVQPEFLVCDEAVAALDVSIQAQILNLFMKLRRELDLTYLFISHDLGVVEHLSDRVVIMYLGRVVEAAPAEEVFRRAEPPLHPGAAGRGAAHRDAQARLRGRQGRDPLAAEPAARLPLPPALPARLRPLPRGAAGAQTGGGGPHQRVPPQRQGLTAMPRLFASILLVLVAVAACNERTRGTSGAYVGGAAGGNIARDR